MPNYFIHALPRSRTAWLANFLSSEDSCCVHAGLLSVGGDIEKLPAKLASIDAEHVGNADSSLTPYPFFERSMQLFPNAKRAFIIRDPAAALISYNKYVPEFSAPIEVFDELSVRLGELANKFGGFVARFEDLNDPDCCDSLHRFCTGRPMDRQRWEMLSKMNVQADRGQWLASMDPETRRRIEELSRRPA